MHFGWQRGAYGLQPPSGQQPWIPPEPAVTPLHMGRPPRPAPTKLASKVLSRIRQEIATTHGRFVRPPMIVARGAKRASPIANPSKPFAPGFGDEPAT